MDKIIIRAKKNAYVQPSVECIKLDNEISLQLESEPPIGPGEFVNSKVSEHFNNTPFKDYSC